MKKNYILNFALITLVFSSHLFSQVNVTFRVDMASETVSTDGIHVVGSINGWNTTSNPLTQEGSTTIYSGVVPLNPGWYEYKFLNGNAWGTEEAAGAPCAPSNGNRFVYINDSGAPVTLEVVPFGNCNAESTGFSATLNVDMSGEPSVSPNGIHVAGGFNGWSTDNLMLAAGANGIYSVNLRLPTPSDYPVVFEYKYINGNAWGSEETPDAGCSTVVNTNRLATVSNSGGNLYDVFNACNYTLSLENNPLNSAVSMAYIKDQGLKINISKSLNIGNLNLEIYDLSGKRIQSTQLTNTSEETIPLNRLNKGVYIAYVSDSFNHKLIKKFMVY
jgi:hypothetical protein